MSESGHHLDGTDEKILSRLRRDARTPITALARAVGLSRGTTQERLRRMERDGIILGYTVRLRASSDALIQAWLALVLARGTTCSQIAADLLVRREVRFCYSLAGPIDVLVLVEAEHASALGECREFIAGLAGVDSVQTFTVLVEHLAP
jgi:DNA-binding Lrp family transcriptional regulator